MLDAFFDALTFLFGTALVSMGLVQLRKPLPTESPFHGSQVPSTRPGAIRVMAWFLVFGGLLFYALFVLGVSGTLQLAY